MDETLWQPIPGSTPVDETLYSSGKEQEGVEYTPRESVRFGKVMPQGLLSPPHGLNLDRNFPCFGILAPFFL